MTRVDDESKANSCLVHTCLTPNINTGRLLKKRTGLQLLIEYNIDV